MSTDPFDARPHPSRPSRRDFFSSMADGLHGAALALLLGGDLRAASVVQPKVYNLKPKQPHFPGRAKSVIQLFMTGGPSQVDLFDPKPRLEKFAGQAPSRDLASEIRAVREAGGLLPSPFKFTRHGQSGIEISELLPHLARQADDLAVIRSMFTTHISHNFALYIMHTGRMLAGRPTLGSWIVYGLGSENQNLPAYVVLDDPKGLPTNGIQNWEAGWLPGVYQGTRVHSEGAPLINLRPAEERPRAVVELSRSLLRRMDLDHAACRPGNPDLEARISTYELAARMQIEASDALDISKESAATQEMYGIHEETTASFGRRCLMARRLVERGVRMIQIFVERGLWDHHSALSAGLRQCCGNTDKPAAALVADLKQRGLLDSTLIVWGGEFGRLPIAQAPGPNVGRDHNPSGFTIWMAGGGVKGGTVYGSTDDIGYKALENRVSVHDFHATILHLLGMDHRRLVYERNGRSERITDEYPVRSGADNRQDPDIAISDIYVRVCASATAGWLGKKRGSDMTRLRSTPHFLAIAVIFCQSALAQEGGGQIVGAVADATRAPVPHTAVTILHKATGVTRSTTTDNYGNYGFAALPIGDYDVTATASGFGTVRHTGVVVSVGLPTKLDFELQPATVRQEVTVTGGAEILNTQSAEGGRVL